MRGILAGMGTTVTRFYCLIALSLLVALIACQGGGGGVSSETHGSGLGKTLGTFIVTGPRDEPVSGAGLRNLNTLESAITDNSGRAELTFASIGQVIIGVTPPNDTEEQRIEFGELNGEIAQFEAHLKIDANGSVDIEGDIAATPPGGSTTSTNDPVAKPDRPEDDDAKPVPPLETPTPTSDPGPGPTTPPPPTPTPPDNTQPGPTPSWGGEIPAPTSTPTPQLPTPVIEPLSPIPPPSPNKPTGTGSGKFPGGTGSAP